MAIKSDASGFLVGELVQSSSDLAHGQEMLLSVSKDMRRDVKSIAKTLNVQVQRSTRVSASARAYTVSAFPAVTPAGRTRTSIAAAKVASSAVAVAPAARDTRGRFLSGRGAGNPNGSQGGGLYPSTIGKLATAVSRMNEVASAAPSIDPTITALKEVKDTLSPLGRGMFSMLGRSAERKKERWYQRILTALTKKKKEPGTVSGGVGGGGGGAMELLGSVFGKMFGGMGGVLGSIPSLLMRAFSRVLGPIAALWGSFELGKWIGGKIYEWLDSSGALAKLFDAVDWIRDTVSGAWKSVTDSVGAAWGSILSGVRTAFNGLMELPKKIGEFFSSIDAAIRKIPIIGDAYGKAVDAIKETAADLKKGYNEADKSKTPANGAQALGRDAATVVKGLKDAGAWVLGKTSQFFESGKRGAGAVSTGKGDLGGASYGTYQLSSRMGTLGKFLGSTEYGKQFEGLTPGTAGFNAKWRQIAKDDPNFGAAQHKFIEDTHYNPQMELLKKQGIDLSGRGDAVKDAVWSTAVQFGNDTNLISKALAGKYSDKMSDADFISRLQDYKVKNNDSLFKKSSAEVRAGTLARAHTEKAALLNFNQALTTSRLPTLASASIPSTAATSMPPSLPAQIPAAELPPEPTRLNSGAGGRTVVASKSQDSVSQNVSDRSIAHIVTGGIGAA